MTTRFAFASLVLMLASPLAAQDDTAPPAPESQTMQVVLETTMGDIAIALEIERAPITAGNFLRYVDEGRFDGTMFYRVMKLDWEPHPNGLVQGGPRMHPDHILPPIAHETTSETGVRHTRGALSMARHEPGSATGDFSILLQDMPQMNADPNATDPDLQAGYAAFGHVVAGMDVVEALYHSPIDPELGEGFLKGEMLAQPVEILLARRITEAEVAFMQADQEAPMPAIEAQDSGDLGDIVDAAAAGVQDAATE